MAWEGYRKREKEIEIFEFLFVLCFFVVSPHFSLVLFFKYMKLKILLYLPLFLEILFSF
jgi:hypothetical protein